MYNTAYRYLLRSIQWTTVDSDFTESFSTQFIVQHCQLHIQMLQSVCHTSASLCQARARQANEAYTIHIHIHTLRTQNSDATANSSAKVPAAAAVGAAGTLAGALESEQQLLSQLVHHVSLADTDVAYQVRTTNFYISCNILHY
jgi:hypothetical protein